MSIPVLCDNGCTVTFTKRTVQVHKDRKTLLTGYREPATKLWRFPQDKTSPPAVPQVTQRINAILPEGTMSDTLNFLHRIMGSPTKTTLLNAMIIFFNVAFLHRKQHCQVSTKLNTHNAGASRSHKEELSIYSTANIQNHGKQLHQHLSIHQPSIDAHREDTL